jgi:hypothetical protein
MVVAPQGAWVQRHAARPQERARARFFVPDFLDPIPIPGAVRRIGRPQGPSTPNAFPFLSVFPSMRCTLHSGCSTAAMPLPRPCNPYPF